jgi:NIMA (never in mitosis gene a)-related kinase 2
MKLSDALKAAGTVSADNDTPSRTTEQQARRQKGRLRTPNPFANTGANGATPKTHTKALSEPQSAMKGVILTDTGEQLPTPGPSNTLMTLLSNSPVRGFKGFRRLADEYTQRERDDDDNGLDEIYELEPASPGDLLSVAAIGVMEPSPSVVAASRTRRPSSAKVQRPNFVSTEPLPSPSESSDESLTNDLDIAHSAPSSFGFGGLGTHHANSNIKLSTPVETSDLEDETQRVSSPYFKRVERTHSRGGSVAANTNSNTNSNGSFKPQSGHARRPSETSRALRTAAAANASKPTITTSASTMNLRENTQRGGRTSASATAGRLNSKSPDEMRRFVSK